MRKAWIIAKVAIFAAGSIASMPVVSAARGGAKQAAFSAGGAKNAPQPPLAAQDAKQVFGAFKTPPPITSRSIGGYAKGCIAGASQLPQTGASWQVMRLSRNRAWGHPALIQYLEKLAADAQRLDGWPGLLVGDLAQPLGGPMVTGHASHQIGLDADIWFKPMPARVLTDAEREDISADEMVDHEALAVDKKVWTEAQVKLLKRAASYPEVARIFVHPAIKKALCEAAGADRGWLRKIQPWWGHHYHFHVRLVCPSGNPTCENQPPRTADDGCGKEVEDWLKRMKIKAPKPSKPVPPRRILMSELPKECRELVETARKFDAVKQTGATK